MSAGGHYLLKPKEVPDRHRGHPTPSTVIFIQLFLESLKLSMERKHC